MVEPTDPIERAIAIHICRANAFLDPDSGERVEDRDIAKANWQRLAKQLPPEKWLWMWNYGRDEWSPPKAGESRK